ncbi:hypothetical protein E8E12_010022 [Didymella heteroderae]|uniref:Structural constituent of ribosome n=1 Tax=Didymella heteroderae TaxID=1769908 RepID=A0A9P5C463_9PLEO|nr:hypothetical protein E8E12_010022 [Didymella heteroderae]
MSAAISYSRAVAPRLAIRTIRCQRFASTQAADAISENREMIIETTPVAKVTTPTPTPNAHKNVRAPTLAERMHKALYPDLYANGQPMPWQVPKERKASEKKPRNKTHGLRIVAPAPAIKKTCPTPIATITANSLKQLDPTGARTRLFDKLNPEAAKLGDILLVRQRTGDPFAGVCIDIRRRGVDTAILLRGQLTRVGVEMWYKIYSPLVEGIEVVQRAAKRARRARLTYMRDVKHDRGSVENVVRVYLRQKASLGAGEGKKKGAEKQKAMQSGKKKGGKKVHNRR